MKVFKPKPASIQWRILLYIAQKNLSSKKLRTGLTVFGISVGIGSVFLLLSFGIGLQELVTSQVIGSQSIKTIDVTTPNSKIVKLDDITVERISKISDVNSVGQAYYFPGSFKIDSSETDTIVYGIDSGYEELTYLNIVAGKNLNRSDDKYPLVINKSGLESIGLADHPDKVIGKSVEITVPLSHIDKRIGTYTHKFTIAGVIDSGAGSEIFIPSHIFKDLGVDQLTQLKAGVDEVANVPKIRTQIETFGLETTSPVDTLNEIGNIFSFFNIILVGFGSVGMFIAVIGMINTLTISLLERTKEIGLMVALGGRAKDMRILFTLEAMLLSIIGTATGMLGAIALSSIVNLVINSMAAGRGVEHGFALFAYPWWLTLGVFVFMAIVGLLVVFIPAKRAERINPITALRQE
ncbi:MAG: ABC transporter permease [Candidatus Saccharimonas sp.]